MTMDRSHKSVAGYVICYFRNYTLRSLLLLSLIFSAATVNAQESPIHFTHSERSLQPGEVVLYEVRSTYPLKKLQISAFDRAFPAFPDEEGLQWTCLVGIDGDSEPGRYDVRLDGVGRNDTPVSAQDTLVVVPKAFPTRRLSVEPKYVTPPASVQDRINKERERVDSIFNATTPEKIWKGPFLLPVPGEVISEFGKRSIYNGKPRSPHSGTDFRGAVGTPIHAPNAGRVVLTADLYYTGNTIILDHGLGLYSYFGHLSSIMVREGDRVRAGDIVGKVGATGRVTGPHLHWTVRLNISRVDPISLVYILENYRKGQGK